MDGSVANEKKRHMLQFNIIKLGKVIKDNKYIFIRLSYIFEIIFLYIALIKYRKILNRKESYKYSIKCYGLFIIYYFV